MTDSRPVSPPSELTADEEAEARHIVEMGGYLTASKWGKRLFATLDAARAAPQADVSMSESCFTLGCYVTRSPDGYNPGLAPQADANLEGYWERAYWEIVPKLAAALDAAPQADAGTLREALDALCYAAEDVILQRSGQWRSSGKALTRLGEVAKAGRAALAASPATAGRDVEMHETPNFPGFTHVAGSEPEICMACRIEAETS
jgi:hypothetical protein